VQPWHESSGRISLASFPPPGRVNSVPILIRAHRSQTKFIPLSNNHRLWQFTKQPVQPHPLFFFFNHAFRSRTTVLRSRSSSGQTMVEGMHAHCPITRRFISCHHPLLNPGQPTRSFLLSQHPRFSRVTRPYSAEEVVNKRGTLPLSYPSDAMGKKLYTILESKARGEGGGCSITYGA
jgi:hypothetical protein